MNTVKKDIQDLILRFNKGNLSDNSLTLFQTLGYATDRQSPFTDKTFASFKDSYLDGKGFREDKALISDWKYVDLLFQLSGEEIEFGAAGQGVLIKKEVEAFGVSKSVIESYLFFTIELSKEQYTRTELSQIAREVNKVFPMPVMIVFKHGEKISISVINRRLHKRDGSRDVLEKVTLIKDISIEKPNRAHIEILFDLSLEELRLKYKFSDFVGLHSAWQKTLDTKELNKRFYKELSGWYFWALQEVSFPGAALHADKHSLFKEEDREKEHNAKNLIRLLTRLLFVWFVKEKGLIPRELFDVEYVSEKLLLNFRPKKGDLASRDLHSSYYRAVLQNLFFATLNQTMGKREFRKPGQHMNVTNLMRYERYFKDSNKFVALVEQMVPFMNGGLFECLDRPDLERKGKQGGDVINYLDGFSDRDDNALIVPDHIFFGIEAHADLSEFYGDKAKEYQNIAVRGLINILDSYKFTVAENTPLEEEVALDPELLGQVFENLLASYNPETKTTARKQTGSFYTPREIVNYMVDESVVEYLKKRFQNAGLSEDSLRALIGYSENNNHLNPEQIQKLVSAIDNCKILDPACGSGAFPMGVLHKLVHLLHKLDPHNALWKQKQLEKAQAIDDSTIREQLIVDIESAFANNELDYGRKLYLIENCIYGVDIQPIAAQISKLRFFISLIVDQKVDKNKENFGIRPLPNLETKFVAANTLIGISRPDGFFRSQEIDQLEEQLKDVRHRLFSAKTPSTKRKLRADDKNLREKMKDLLVDNGWENESARRLSSWDPYDQNASSPFFDAEWMFGVTVGFDIVIGNPPYVQIQNFSGMPQQKEWEKQKYQTYAKTGDVYCLFYEQGYNFLRDSGVLTYITSNKWMRANYGKAIRKYFLENGRISQLIDFGDSPIFENATTYTNILIWNKDTSETKTKAWDLSYVYVSETSLNHMLDQVGECETLFGEDSFVLVKREHTVIKKRIEEIGKPLKQWDISINFGIKTGLNEAFIIDGKTKDELVTKDPKCAEIIKPILRGRDIKRYKAEFADLWLINTHNGYTDKIGQYIPPIDVKKEYPSIWEHLKKINKETDGQVEKRYDQGAHWSNLRSCAYFSEIEKEKIFYPEIVYDSAFYFDKKAFYPEATTFIITGEKLKFLTALLNSRLLTYAFKTFYAGGDLRGSTFRYKKVFLELLPVPKPSPDVQLHFEILVDCILFCKDRGLEQESTLLESVVDGLVYDLYFPNEMRIANCYITDRIAEVIKPFKNSDTVSFKTEYITKLCEFCRKDKIVYHGLIHRRTVKEVQTITGEKE